MLPSSVPSDTPRPEAPATAPAPGRVAEAGGGIVWLVHRGLEALLTLGRPRAAARQRRAEREAALAEGRRALARLRLAASNTRPREALLAAPALAPAAGAIETLEAAVLSLDAIAARLREAAELAATARTCPDEGARALLAERYDEIREEIDGIARTAYGGRTNLLDGLGGTLDVPLDTSGRARMAISGVDATSGPQGLALPAPKTAFAADAEIAAVARALEAALAGTAAHAERFEMEAAVLAARIATSPHAA